MSLKKNDQLNQFLAGLKYSDAGHFAISSNAIIVFWNPALEKMSGISEHKALEQNIATIFPLFRESRFDKKLQEIMAADAVSFSPTLSSRIFAFPGRATRVTAQTRKIAESDLIIFTLCDISFLSKQVGELTGQKESLEKRLLEITRDSADKLRNEEQLRQALESRSEFISQISLEISEPMTIIKDAANQLEQSGLSHEQRNDLRQIQHAASDIQSFLDSLSRVASMDPGATAARLTLFDPRDLTQAIAEQLRPVVLRRQNILSVKYPARALSPVESDVISLRQIILHLIQYANRALENGSIELELDTTCCLSIALNSMISGEHHEVASSVSSENDLSLIMANRLAHFAGFRLITETESGRVKMFKLMCHPEAPQVAQPSGKNFALLHPLKILIVDDSRDSLVLTCQLLKGLGYSPETAQHGLEALQMLAQTTFDLVLLDIRMPVMDGFETARIIRSRYGNEKIKLAAFSARHPQKSDLELFDAYLSKPVNGPGLKELIQSIVIQ